MDSISQIVLGASIAHVVLGEKLGRRALLVGAVVGTLPDLDVLVPYADAIESFTYHRSWSHSLFMLTLFSFPLAVLCKRLMPKAELPFCRWWLALWLVLVTHPLLDGFTVYGTQIWWPLSTPPTAWGSVFIIDPAYTLPLLVGVVMAWRRQWLRARPMVIAGLLISSTYLGWTLVAQHITRQKVSATLAHSAVEANHVLIAPFPFSVLWRVVVVADDRYFEGYSSLLDGDSEISMQSYSNGKQACSEWLDHWPVQRMDWFTHGAFALSVKDDVLVLSDLRMGVEDDYVFEFAVAERQAGAWQPIVTRQMPVEIDADRMKLLLARIVDPNVDLTPLTPSHAMAEGECVQQLD
ncbi:metal-dependent hydrolase [Granulosicoccus antarcticus]|uniref:Inner membrane protein YbcI n=1 Tax=Granulosicoccus antarcticus IMCC3135 TaxID=1192854 RepID=A0A2Z2P1C2_9GAMM|nr:metal-dependent hydrolase [Granulosicoccus antarcticus]ASJ76311.1 hypothetical protein IMCC3135_31315 [Granulosicoccus antarcticus IMCC3135]